MTWNVSFANVFLLLKSTPVLKITCYANLVQKKWITVRYGYLVIHILIIFKEKDKY